MSPHPFQMLWSWIFPLDKISDATLFKALLNVTAESSKHQNHHELKVSSRKKGQRWAEYHN